MTSWTHQVPRFMKKLQHCWVEDPDDRGEQGFLVSVGFVNISFFLGGCPKGWVWAGVNAAILY